MNVAFFLKPKMSVAYLLSDFTIRQSLEKMAYYGYSAIPVVSRDGKYDGTVSEGDFLWFMNSNIKDGAEINCKLLEEVPLKKILKKDGYKPVKITADMDELLNAVLNQNFVPVIDDLGSFCGIVTRRDVIKHLLNNGSDSVMDIVSAGSTNRK